MNKIQQHFRRNKRVYLTAGTIVIVAGVAYYVGSRSATAAALKASAESGAEVVQSINQTAIPVGCYKPTINQTVNNFIERSSLSKPIGLLSEDGKSVTQSFASIKEAARQTGLDRASISKNVNKVLDDVKGNKFIELEPLVQAAA